MLTKIKRFAQHHGCHVWFVAHPRQVGNVVKVLFFASIFFFSLLICLLVQQLHHWVGSPPNLYDISGSAHFINKCDNGIVIHRNRDPEAGPIDQVQVIALSGFVHS